ncbi:response regulator transcription factor [Anaerocolumna xylanovorans]|nr:response regulator [Anaerocolumna xylanovorans]
MYKTLLVDDEINILNGMAAGIPWEKWGYEVIGMARDGLDAAEMIEANCPDVVVSDIRMPHMDGVELMKYLNNNHPEVKIIILSGYNDVEYLNMAIKNGVVEYLFKPTDIDEFEECFARLKRRLDDEKFKREERDRIYKQAGDNKLYRQSHYLRQMVKGLKEEDEQLNIDFSDYFMITGEVMEDNEEGGNVELLTLKNRMVQYCNMRESYYQVHFFLDDRERITGIMSVPKGIEDWKKFAFKYIQSLHSELLDLYQKKSIMGISSLCHNKEELPAGYEQAVICLEQRMMLQTEPIGIYDDAKEPDRKDQIRFPAELMWSYIENYETEKLRLSVAQVFAQIGSQISSDYSFVDRLCLEFLYDAAEYARNRRNISLAQIMGEEKKQYRDIYFLKNLKKKQEFMEEVLISLLKAWKGKEENKGHVGNLADYIRNMVDKEYSANYMSLDYIGEKIKKNPSYISKIFKLETGKNFSDYIMDKRMDKAKEMLKDFSIKIYEIAEATGYADVSNFIRVFKRYTGLSPNEYRNVLMKQADKQEKNSVEN